VRTHDNGEPGGAGPRSTASLPDHPVRTALLELLAETGTITATEAAQRLGYSSGLCSFHLRQLARHGVIEEAPHRGRGRVRPWRLRTESTDHPTGQDVPGFDDLARSLEDESYQRWLAHRAHAPAEWQRDESFSAVVHLTPEEMTELAEALRRVLRPYQERGERGRGPAGTTPAGAIIRLFPLLAEPSDTKGTYRPVDTDE